MEFLTTMLIVAVLLAAVLTPNRHSSAQHRVGETVAHLEARLKAECARTYLPLR